MLKNFNIKPPFFEIGPKAYLYGEEMLALAKVIDKTAMKYDLDVIVTPQYTDLKLLCDNTERIFVFAQHMDYLKPGRGLGSVLPEAVKAAGAKAAPGKAAVKGAGEKAAGSKADAKAEAKAAKAAEKAAKSQAKKIAKQNKEAEKMRK